MPKCDVGTQIREWRQHRALSLRRCAALVGLDKAELSRIEQGQMALTSAAAWKLAMLFPEVLALSGVALQAVDLRQAQRRPDLDDKARGLCAFVLAGGLRVMLPVGLAKALA